MTCNSAGKLDQHPFGWTSNPSARGGWLRALQVSPDWMEAASHPFPSEIKGKGGRKFNRKCLKTDKFTGLNHRKDMAPEIISLLELRDKIHVSPCELLTMPRSVLDQIISQFADRQQIHDMQFLPTLQELIRLNKAWAKLLDHLSKLQWRSVKWLRLRKIAGICN